MNVDQSIGGCWLRITEYQALPVLEAYLQRSIVCSRGRVHNPPSDVVVVSITKNSIFNSTGKAREQPLHGNVGWEVIDRSESLVGRSTWFLFHV